MCVPVLAAAAIASAVVGSASQVMSGIAQSQQARYSANIADQNAHLAADQANDATLNTNLALRQRYREGAQTAGRQTAAMAANGIDLNFGSAVNVQEDTAMIVGEDAAQIAKQGFQQARGHDIEAWNYQSQAAADRAKGKSAMLQGIMGGISTALGAASQFGGSGGKFGTVSSTKGSGA